MTPALTEIEKYTPVFERLAEEYGLTWVAVDGRMSRYCHMNKHVCRASQEKVACDLGIDKATVRRHIHALVDDGYLEDVAPDLKNRPHTYRDIGKVGLQVNISPYAESEGAALAESKGILVQSEGTPVQSHLKIQLKPEPKAEKSFASPCGDAERFPRVESWEPSEDAASHN